MIDHPLLWLAAHLPLDAVRCPHGTDGSAHIPTDPACEGCQRDGSRALRLRMCLTCAYVGCCDSSPRRHARTHFEVTGHPVMRSIEPGDAWAWCYVDDCYLAGWEPRPI